MEYLNILRDKHNVTSLRWDSVLENQAKIYANSLKDDNDCKYKKRNMYSELFTDGEERLTEKEVCLINYRLLINKLDFRKMVWYCLLLWF